ncbi:MAG: hypothetical protein ACUVRR_03855 [Candidatus Fervidibacter sp.]|uniref:hypothetical protein n=1 Tax=Candidatus Fervidibacter sp. TaxID=3100871 RepID=UPI00404A9D40
MWTKNTELEFFRWVMTERKVDPQHLFYRVDNRFLFYLPDWVKGKGEVKQARNRWGVEFTELWAEKFLKPVVEKLGWHLVRGATIAKLGLVGQRAADIAICRKPNKTQQPEDVIAIVEVKMSLVWNWEWKPEEGKIDCAGDFLNHQGRPSVQRSDTVLKALGKAIEVRGKGYKGVFFALFNAPIPADYQTQVDGCKQTGVIQGFFSVNPQPLDEDNEQVNFKRTQFEGFLQWDTLDEVFDHLSSFLAKQHIFFSGFLPLEKLGKLIIEEASWASSP